MYHTPGEEAKEVEKEQKADERYTDHHTYYGYHTDIAVYCTGSRHFL